jgi:hypothetical protein
VRTAVPYGIGGYGGGGDAAEPELAMEAAPEEFAAPVLEGSEALKEPAAAEPAPAQTEEETTADNSARIEPTLQPNGIEKSAPGETFAQEVPIEAAPQVQPAPPIGVTLQIVLAVIAILSAIIALTLRYTSIRKWRAKAR